MAIVTPGADTAHVPESTALTKITQAYRYEIDPTPGQVTALRSHIGATRFCYNVLLGLVKENWDAVVAAKAAAKRCPVRTTSVPTTSITGASGTSAVMR